MVDLYSLIQQLCKQRNITIALLERECSLGNGTIKKWGDTIPSADRLKRVADYFGVTIDYLLGESEERKNKMDEHSSSMDWISKHVALGDNIEDVINNLDLTQDQIELYKKVVEFKSKDRSYCQGSVNYFYNNVNDALLVAYDLERISDIVSDYTKLILRAKLHRILRDIDLCTYEVQRNVNKHTGYQEA